MTVLAEMLNQRKAAFERLHEVQTQIAKDAIMEEPDVEDSHRQAVTDLVDNLDAIAMSIQVLTVRINSANIEAQVTFEGTAMSLMEAIALRDRLQLIVKQREQVLTEIETDLGVVATGRRRRYFSERALRNKDEIKEVSVIDLRSFRDTTKHQADRVRALDIEIQKVNWSHEA